MSYNYITTQIKYFFQWNTLRQDICETEKYTTDFFKEISFVCKTSLEWKISVFCHRAFKSWKPSEEIINNFGTAIYLVLVSL